MKGKSMAENQMKIFSMEHSKYTFVYPENKEYLVRVYRSYGTPHETDVTGNVFNNVLLDLFLEAVNLREKIEEMQNKEGE